MPKSLVLICEGGTADLDFRILDKVLRGVFRLSVDLQPAQGNLSVKAIAEWFEHRHFDASKTSSKQAIGQTKSIGAKPKTQIFSIRDRDYLSTGDVEDSWRDGSRKLIWRRHEIENYLIDPKIVHRFFGHVRDGIALRWADGLPTNFNDVCGLLLGIAQQRFDHHVGRLLFHDLRNDILKYGDGLNLAMPSISAKEAVPSKQEWLDALNSETSRVQRNCRGVAAMHDWDEGVIARRFDEIAANLEQDGFTSSERCLREIDGKELIWGLWAFLNRDRGLAELDISKLTHELVTALVRFYQSGEQLDHDDFIALRDRLEATS